MLRLTVLLLLKLKGNSNGDYDQKKRDGHFEPLSVEKQMNI